LIGDSQELPGGAGSRGGDRMEYDLSSVVAKFLDPHLSLPIVGFHQERGLLSKDESLKLQSSILDKTKLVDYHSDVVKAMGGGAEKLKQLEAQRNAVIEEYKQLEDFARPMIELVNNKDLVGKLRRDKAFNVQFLEEMFGIQEQQNAALYRFAKLLYETGSYERASTLMESYALLSPDNAGVLASHWGRFAASILQAGADQQWQHAHTAMMALKDVIDTNKLNVSPMNLVHQRAWLMHWGLFIFFNHPSGRSLLVDLFMQDAYLNALQTLAPHLLRYFAVSVLANRDRRSAMKELIRTLKQETYQYRDPITEFVLCLYSEYNFDRAHEMLVRCQEVMERDYFLCHWRDSFVQNARQVIFEMYCRLHSAIDIRSLADKLSMEHDDAEKWIVDLVSSANLNAKIDSAAGTVVMGPQHKSAVDMMMDSARNLTVRTYNVADQILASLESNVV